MVRTVDVGVPRRVCLRLLLAAGLGVAAPARGLEGGAGPSEPSAGDPRGAVGSLSAGDRLLSGVLIDAEWVLTAAHVVAGAAPPGVVFRSSLGGGFSSRARAVHLHPLSGTARVDLALVRLEAPAPAAIPRSRLFGGPMLGQVIHLVSHGGSTTLMTVGENRVDAVQPDSLGLPLVYLFDFDGPDLRSNALGPALPAMGTLGPGREATLVSGDSGSAAFVVIDGQWGLAGINTFQATVTPPAGGPTGRVAGGIVLAPQAGWISRTLRGQSEPGRPPKPANPAVGGSGKG